jgi:hypothetical protein
LVVPLAEVDAGALDYRAASQREIITFRGGPRTHT